MYKFVQSSHFDNRAGAGGTAGYEVRIELIFDCLFRFLESTSSVRMEIIYNREVVRLKPISAQFI